MCLLTVNDWMYLLGIAWKPSGFPFPICPFPPVASHCMQSKSLKLLYGPQRPPNVPIMSLAASPTTHSLACSVPVTLSSTLFLKPVKQSSLRASPHVAWSALTLLPLDICSLPLPLQVFAQWISGAVSGYCLSNNNPNPNPTPNTP